MFTSRTQPLSAHTFCKAVVCLVFAGFVFTGCERDSTADQPAPAAATPLPANEQQADFGLVLRANPNPVPAGNAPAKTTITWQTGSDAEAEIFYFDGNKEIPFATGAKGSKEADFIQPGSNEFRLYNKGDRKMAAQLIVTMP